MRQLGLKLCAVLLCSFASVAISKEFRITKAESVGISSERLARIEPAMQRYVDASLTPGIVTAIMRKGKLVHFSAIGDMDVASRKPMQRDAIFRIASMTKPIASVALMILWEKGHFQLRDPLSRFIPAFGEAKVRIAGELTSVTDSLEEPRRPIQVRDMLTHTAGLANNYIGDVAAYRTHMTQPRPKNNAEQIARLASFPLNYHPGEEWQYSSATSVVGHLAEIISGQSLDVFLEENLFKPLDMKDTHFYLDDTKGGRLTTQYTPGEDNKITPQDPGDKESRWITSERSIFSGSGGLVSTARDYLRFQQMMLNGGELDGVRILSPSTVSLMLENHTGDLDLWLPGPGMGFGLGYGIVMDRGEAATPLSQGAAYWGGAFCTISWIDPEKELVGLLMTQVRPYTHINIRQDFQVLTYQALLD